MHKTVFWMTCECQIIMIMFNYSIDLKARFPENPFLGKVWLGQIW